jgi:hypothetical protein
MIQVTLPVYYIKTYKTKPSVKIFVGQNWFRNAHYRDQNKVKQDFASVVALQVTNSTPIKGAFTVEYTYYYKNKLSDLANVCALSSKIVLDALQDVKLIENDNVQYCIQETYKVGTQDTHNPRVEITLTPIP